MRLVDIKSAAQSPHRDCYSRPPRTAHPATGSAECVALSLCTLAEFLNALLNILLASAPKILTASLSSRDADGFCCNVRPGSIQRQARKIACARAAVSVCCSRTSEAGKSILHGKVLESAARGRGAVRAVRLLFLLPGSQHQLRFHFPGSVFRIEHHFLRHRSESHELDLHHVAAARDSLDYERAIYTRCNSHFFSGKRVCCSNGHPRQGHLPAFHHAGNLKSCWSGWGSFLSEPQAHKEHSANQRHADQHDYAAKETFQSGYS